MRWGRLHEKTIADEWQHRRQSVIRNVGLISNVETPWLQCTLDRRVVECPDNRDLKSRCALEVKTRGAFRNTRWHADVPDDILAQCMTQMIVTGYRHIHVACLVGGSELHDVVVWWDGDLADYLIREITDFRERFLIPNIEPPWSDVKPGKEIDLDGQLNPERVGEIGIADVGEVIEYAQLARQAGMASRAKDRAKARLLEIADGKQLLTFADHPAVWWREGTDTTVNLEALARHPEVYANVVTTRTTWTLCVAKEYKASSESRVS
jgi:predicted phage-related endonuclease